MSKAIERWKNALANAERERAHTEDFVRSVTRLYDRPKHKRPLSDTEINSIVDRILAGLPKPPRKPTKRLPR